MALGVRPIRTVAATAVALALCAGVHSQAALTPCDQMNLATGIGTALDKQAQRWVVTYQMSDTAGVTSAWMEYWVQSRRYAREAVPILQNGRVDLRGADAIRRRIDMMDYAERLDIGIRTARVGPIISDADPDERRHMPKDEVYSDIEVGQSPDARPPYPAVDGDAIRIVEGAGETTAVLTGRNFLPDTRILLIERIGEKAPFWAERHYLRTTYIDPGHLRVVIPAGDTAQPLVLAAIALAADQDIKYSTLPLLDFVLRPTVGEPQLILVVHRDSPVLESITPGAIPTERKEFAITLRGRGFSPTSQVSRWHPVAGPMPVEFVSPTELRVKIKLESYEGWFDPGPINFWVSDNGDPTRFSAPRSLQVTVVGRVRTLGEPRIRTVSPYPIPLLDDRSPELLPLTITGTHFKKNDTVVALAFPSEKWVGLRTEYVSPQEMRAWLPRRMWFWRRGFYRFVVEKGKTSCVLDRYDGYPDYRTFSDPIKK